MAGNYVTQFQQNCRDGRRLFSSVVTSQFHCIAIFKPKIGSGKSPSIVYTPYDTDYSLVLLIVTSQFKNPFSYFRSLAVADLLVSAIVVPFAACFVFREEDPSSFPWINSIFCGVFIFLDVTCCTVSILHLCAIAWVR